jgi:CHAT domain-containing protein
MGKRKTHPVHLTRLGRIRFVLWLALVLVCLIQLGLTQPSLTQPGPTQLDSTRPDLAQPTLTQQPASSPLEQAQIRYEAGDLRAAVDLLHQALNQLPNSASDLERVVIQANLALAYQQLGQWQVANQAIAASQQLLAAEAEQRPEQEQLEVLAQVRSVQGQIQLAQGQTEAALSSWQQAETLYRQLGNDLAAQQSQFNQSQALQALGLYRRASTLLMDLNLNFEAQPPETSGALRIASLRSLAEVLLTLGDLGQSRQVLEQAFQLLDAPFPLPNRNQTKASLEIAQANLIRLEATRQLSLTGLTSGMALEVLTAPAPAAPDLTTAALNQRRQTAAQQFRQQLETALQLYQRAAQVSSSTNLSIDSPISRSENLWADQTKSRTNSQLDSPADLSLGIQANLYQIAVLRDLGRRSEALALVQQLGSLVTALPVSQPHLYQQINLAQAQLQLEPKAALPLLKQVIAQATALQDRRTQSFGLGILGQGYEQTQDWPEAIQATQQALLLAQAIQAPDLAYRWQWQLGRLLNQQGQTEAAIAAYGEAVNSLQLLRQDLVAINRDLQFSFQAQVEPVYRELVELLTVGETVSQSRLAQARSAIEALQIAELENFFQEACLDTKLEIDRVIDRARPAAAVFYTIVLPDRIEVILKLPNQELQHYRSAVDQKTVAATVDELVNQLKQPYLSQRSKQLSQQVYDWLIKPVEAQLQSADLETLVFVLDSDLRSLPLAALFDGEKFLLETYSIALAPGLRLADPLPLGQAERRLKVLAAGLSEARANFPPLAFVAEEIATIQTETQSRVLFNQSFTQANLKQQLSQADFAVVHIATHGQFSSNAADTFILAWDQPINIITLSQLLQAEAARSAPVELLVLSACQTAVGDRRATLGMAGVAVRAGARSTIASLWNLEDDSGAMLMAEFYRSFSQAGYSKAEALRQAQLSLLKTPEYAAPRFWAPYILLGNWL